MAIIFEPSTKTFYLDGKGITYAFYVNEYGYVEHLYFGKTIAHDDLRYARQRGAFSSLATVPGQDGGTELNSYHHFPTETAFFGTSDYREPMVLVRGIDGFSSSELLYQGYDILSEKPKICGMPSSTGGETLVIHISDTRSTLTCDLYYTVWGDCSVIARRAVYTNKGADRLTLERAYSFSLSLGERNYNAVTLYGAWANERHIQRTPLTRGCFCIDSKRTTSSAALNPFLAIASECADESNGDVYGISLVYSSSFVLKAEGTSDGRTLITGGVNDFAFSWILNSDESFETPEVLLTFSPCGLGGMSRELHRMMRDHLLRRNYVNRRRPIVINNWEGTYYDFDVEKLKRIADGVKDTGVDTFVLDDGWFRKNNNSKTSLGDWKVNEKKFPNGLDEIIEYVNSIGFHFGLWIEPEMISEDSELYRAHPDWIVGRIGEKHCYGRHQLMLDLTRADVREYIIDTVNRLLQKNRIDYVKWDYNRNITEAYSGVLPSGMQAGFCHKYALGLYDICDRIILANPEVFFEGCSSGGARLDPAMLCYFPQIWTSDNTDAAERTLIQYGTSVAYPLSTASAHVSAVPNHQTGRVTDMATRSDIAHLGPTGYELDSSVFCDEDRRIIKEQVEQYRRIEPLLLDGDLWRTENPFDSEYFGFMVVSRDKMHAVLTVHRRLCRTNDFPKFFRVAGLDDNQYYCVSGIDRILSGSTLMNIGIPTPFEKNDFQTEVYYFDAVNN